MGGLYAALGASSEFEATASSARNVWIAFVTFEAYLFITIVGVTHRDLFFEKPVRLPLFGVDVPLAQFFFLAPFLLLCFHTYFLLHLSALHHQWIKFAPDKHFLSGDRIPPSFPLASLYSIGWIQNALLRKTASDIVILTVLVGPVLLLLMMQLTFLPYHHHTVVWSQRAAIVIDILCLYKFWPSKNPHSANQDSLRTYVPKLRHTVLHLLALITVCFSLFIATFPGEPQENNVLARAPLPIFRFNDWVVIPIGWVGYIEFDEKDLPGTIYEALFNGHIDYRTGQRISLFSNSLILPNFDAAADEHLERIENREVNSGLGRIFEPSLSVRGRDFRNAVFTYSDMRHIDFLGADLRNADFTGASLSGVRMSCQAINKGSYGFFCTRLQGSVFDVAQVQNADFHLAEMQGASFQGARLQSSNLMLARLQGANFTNADIQGANLLGADLTGATLDEAVLYGALLRDSTLAAASFRKAQIQGTWLSNANLNTADLRQTYVWRSHGTDVSFSDSLIAGVVSGPIWKQDIGEDEPLTTKSFEELKMWANVGVPKAARGDLSEILEVLNPDKPNAFEEIPWSRLQADSVSETQHMENEAVLLLKTLCSDPESAYILRSLENAGRLERNQALSDRVTARKKETGKTCAGLSDLN